MSKSFRILVFLVLFGSYSDHVAGQAISDKSRPQTNIEHPKNPINSDARVRPILKEPNGEAKELYREGMKLTEAGQFSQAAEYLQQAVRLDQEYAEAYSALGRAYFKMREWQKAAGNLRRAVELRTKHQAPQSAVYGRVLVQESKEASTQVKVGPTIPHIKQEANANAAELKPVRPELLPTRRVEHRQEANSTVKTDRSTPAINPLQETRANAAALKQRRPASETILQTARREEISTPPKVTPTSPQIRLQQQTNPGVRRLESEATQQPEKREEANTPAKAASTNSQAELPQGTDANTAGLKAVIPKLESETMRQPEQPEEVSSPAKAILTIPGIKLPQETNAGVRPLESEITLQPEQTADAVSPLKSNDYAASEREQEPAGARVAMNVTLESRPLETKSISPTSTAASSDEVSLAKIYRVGPSDVLDIRLNDSQSAQSTLFAVTPTGLLEHLMLTEPLSVTGLTVEEIGTKIVNDLKKRALVNDPKVVVGVSDYASHTILVSGLVKESGTKFLRREAIPLYVVVADAQPLPEAARVTVRRNELNQIYEIDLTKAEEMSLLVRPGDVITLQPNVKHFVYIGGEVKFPGEKTFRRGLTLMQAIIAAGGVSPKSKGAEVGREDGRGFLVGTHFDLEDIQTGKAADPLLEPGDRIMVLH
jgi:polysaccharide export outer membrane protein